MPRPKESFAVLGLSKFGYRTAVGLFDAGATVIAVDRDANLVQLIAQQVSKAVQADAMNFDVMEHIGVFDVDTVVIGFRSAFDAAVLLTHHLRTKTKVHRIIAQVDTEQKAEALRRLGVDRVVFPERDIADRLVRRLTVPDLVEHIPLSQSVAIHEVPAPESFVGKTITDLQIRSRYHIYVIGIKRRSDEAAEAEVLLAPPPNTTFRARDSMLLLGTTEDLARFTKET